ncbi:LysM peptidoglycan-binding domain-containing protein [Pedobacter sp. AW1-32]|uniref:LysM peptidoglycan-binding domain-containing protein n=1 Tax=Pedobacter sp. AW1-32 TaxID=3383026 RepID=UPI003FF11548
MRKIYLSAVLLLAINIANAKASAVRDSIGVENNKGKKVIVHQIVAKDTYYSIGRRYNVAPKDIMAFNENKYLQIGVIIKVPTQRPFDEVIGNNSSNPPAVAFITHTVSAKENLNLIAEKYGTTVNQIKSLNNLSNNNLSIGQVLKIEPKNNTVQVSTTTTAQSTTPIVEPTPVQQPANADETIIEHTVAAKEFLGKIAEKYGTTVESIKKANGLTGNNLRIGQKLKIPATKNIDENKVVSTAEPVNSGNHMVKSNDQPGTHTVTQGETIFTIAKQYGITAYQIRSMNNLSDNTLNIGQVLKVPGGIVTAVEVPKEQQNTVPVTKTPVAEPKEESFIHTVATGENIFSIAKKYSLTAYQIRLANKLNNNTLTVGQKLAIPKPPQARSVNEVSKEDQEDNPDSTDTLKDPKLRRDPSVYGLSQMEEKGTAVWIADKELDSSKMLVLHRTAPVGRIIKITNPMTNRSTFAKVVGKFTENESTKDVIIVVTKAVADSLGALDKRFFCNITYNNESAQ